MAAPFELDGPAQIEGNRQGPTIEADIASVHLAVEQLNDVARRSMTTQRCCQVRLSNAQPIAQLLARALSHCAPRVSPTAILLARAVQNIINAMSTTSCSHTSVRGVWLINIRCALASATASACAAAACCCLAPMRVAAQLQSSVKWPRA